MLVNAGLSLLNRNSEYMRTDAIFNEEGEVVDSTTSMENYNFSANKVSVGYGKGKSKIMMGIYISRNTKYFDKKRLLLFHLSATALILSSFRLPINPTSPLTSQKPFSGSCFYKVFDRLH